MPLKNHVKRQVATPYLHWYKRCCHVQSISIIWKFIHKMACNKKCDQQDTHNESEKVGDTEG